MRNFNTKIDNDNTSAGVVVADEYNSLFGEAKNVVTPFFTLDEANSQQMIKSVDIVSKAMFYTDVGAVNAIELERGATTQTIETLFDGMVVMFTPANANTGATTLKIKTLDAKPLKYNGADLASGFFKTTSKYIAIYDVANGWFNVDLLVNYADLDGLDGTLPLLGVGQTWQEFTIGVTRIHNTNYTNTTGKPIMVIIEATGTINRSVTIDGKVINFLSAGSTATGAISFIVPNNSTYKSSGESPNKWFELR